MGQQINTDKFILEKICKNFDKLFIINTGNLRFFSSGKSGFNNKVFFFDKKKRKLIVKNNFF